MSQPWFSNLSIFENEGFQAKILNVNDPEWPNMADNIAQWIKSGAQENEKTRLTALWR